MMTNLPQTNKEENDLLHLSLDEIARNGAKKLLMAALELEVEEYLKTVSHLKENNKSLVVRNGRAKERKITVGSGTFSIRAPRVNDKRINHKYSSKILPPYLRKSPKVESILPLLYLKGLSGNSFKEALSGLLGDEAGGLSATSISSLKKIWQEEYDQWKNRKIDNRFVYIWADGVNVSIRLGEDKKICLLVVIGVREDGKKELLSVEAGYRESKESWLYVLRSLVERGLNSPSLAIGDGALGFWSALREIPQFKNIKEQRCWVHKLGNILDKLPKRLRVQSKNILQEIMNAPTLDEAIKFKEIFKHITETKYPKAYNCLDKDWNELTSFFNFPAKHWPHIKTTNPIESAFATVKLRTFSTKGAGSANMATTMAFKLLIEAEGKWRKIRGSKDLQKIIEGKIFKDGILEDNDQEQKDLAA